MLSENVLLNVVKHLPHDVAEAHRNIRVYAQGDCLPDHCCYDDFAALQDYIENALGSDNDDLARLVRYDLQRVLRIVLEASVFRIEKHCRKEQLLAPGQLDVEYKHIDVLRQLAEAAHADVSSLNARLGVVAVFLEENHQRFLDNLRRKK